MLTLIAGLVLFLGAHSTRIFADGWRTATIAQIGDRPWRGLYALVSVVGFVLIVVGYGIARRTPWELWPLAPMWTHDLAGLLMLASLVLLAAAYVPGNQLKATLHHPMLLAVILWSIAHVVANNTVPDVVLFGAFGAWAVVDLGSSVRRDQAAGTAYPPGRASRTAMAVAIGVVAWVAIAFWLHLAVIGVQPLRGPA
jgi:uncharacterized membrane protein